MKLSIANIHACDCNTSPHKRTCADFVLPTCPKCGAEDSMEHVKTDYHGIETHYDECVVCQHRTDPE